jgi:hypothetical protein
LLIGHDELRDETPALCVEGFEAVDNAGGHHDGLVCLNDPARLANAEQCSPRKEMNDFIACVIMHPKGPGGPLADDHLAMATIRLLDRQRGSRC